MKTNDLITMLVADGAQPRTDTKRYLFAASACGALAAALLLTFTVGVRGDFKTAVQDWRFVAKFAIAAAVVLGMTRAALLLSRPEIAPRAALRSFVAPLGLLAAALLAEMSGQPASGWLERAIGSNSLVCLATVPLLASAPLIALLFALKSGAPQSPALLGAVAGALAGGIGAFFYAAHCTDDSPLFVAIWYTLAILIVSVIGSIAGRRILAW